MTTFIQTLTEPEQKAGSTERTNMATKSKAKKTSRQPENQDLAGLTGPGIAPVKIGAIDNAIRRYVPAKNRRVDASREEVTTKKKLIDLLHKHAEEIGKDGDGIIRYRFDGKIYELAPSDEKLHIFNDTEEE